jgi:hypothetical protein
MSLQWTSFFEKFGSSFMADSSELFGDLWLFLTTAVESNLLKLLGDISYLFT